MPGEDAGRGVGADAVEGFEDALVGGLAGGFWERKGFWIGERRWGVGKVLTLTRRDSGKLVPRMKTWWVVSWEEESLGGGGVYHLPVRASCEESIGCSTF